MKQFGLIGYPLSHSFSEKYFKEKFRKEHITDSDYKLFQIKLIDQFPELIIENPSLCGLNVTVPYKKSVIDFLDELDEIAKVVGAVNCIKVIREAGGTKLIGYNTDVVGFEASLKSNLKSCHKKALILGTGGSAKAVAFVLKKREIAFSFVSRNPKGKNIISYNDLTGLIIKDHLLIINTTPLGMFPDTQTFPEIPYEYLTAQHLLFDLVYNPIKTLFLDKGQLQGASIINGLEMLYVQAEKSFEIWNS